MALIPCPDCSRDVSSVAPACPQCGRPIAATTVEATGKRWKLMEAVGVLAICLGVLSFPVLQAWMISTDWMLVPFGGGFALWLIARIGAWWRHG